MNAGTYCWTIYIKLVELNQLDPEQVVEVEIIQSRGEDAPTKDWLHPNGAF